MRDTVALGCVDRALQELRVAMRTGACARPGDHQKAVLHEQLFAAVALELAPDFMRAPRELRVLRTFAAGEPGDPGLAMGRAFVMRRRKLIDAEHFSSALGELVQARTAHRAETDDNDVKFFH